MGDRAYIGVYGKKSCVLEELSVGAVSVRDYATTEGFAQVNPGEKRTYIYLGRGTDYSKDDVPDCSWSVASRLEWLAGLIDSDGCVVTKPSPAIQISAKSGTFLMNVQLMLNTIGCSAHVAPTKDCWRLSISPSDLMGLVDLGLHLRRVDVSGSRPTRNAARFVQVTDVKELDEIAPKVYCFTGGFSASRRFRWGCNRAVRRATITTIRRLPTRLFQHRALCDIPARRQVRHRY